MYNNTKKDQALFNISEVVSILNCGIGKNGLFAFLRKKHILQNDNTPFPYYEVKGYFTTCSKVVPTKFGRSHTYSVTLATESGLSLIMQLLNEKESPEVKTQQHSQEEMWIEEMTEVDGCLHPIIKLIRYDLAKEDIYPRWVFNRNNS